MQDLRKQQLLTHVGDFKHLTLQSVPALRHCARPSARERGQDRTGGEGRGQGGVKAPQKKGGEQNSTKSLCGEFEQINTK